MLVEYVDIQISEFLFIIVEVRQPYRQLELMSVELLGGLEALYMNVATLERLVEVPMLVGL